jgi:hypothetical protein
MGRVSNLPLRALPAPLPSRISFQRLIPSAVPPKGPDRIHEIKHDGHRLVAIADL